MGLQLPQGIEVLIRKAAVDDDFARLLLADRAAAAEEIGLELQPAEAAMLAAVPADQLEAIIAQTDVPQEHRRAFLGKAAAAMIAALGVMGGTAAAARMPAPTGSRPPELLKPFDDPRVKSVHYRTTKLLAEKLSSKLISISSKTIFADLELKDKEREEVRLALEKEFDLPLPKASFAKQKTVGDTIKQLEVTEELQSQIIEFIGTEVPVSDVKITRHKTLAADLKMEASGLKAVHEALQKKYSMSIPWQAFKDSKTVGDAVACVVEAYIAKQKQPKIPSPVTRGVRPDRPPMR